jgi:arginyl-tRNA synthetase
MSILAEMKRRFRPVLAVLPGDPEDLLAMIVPTKDPKFGDYQANFAMSLGKQPRRPPREPAKEIAALSDSQQRLVSRFLKSAREFATEIANSVDLTGFCLPPEVAGPGFINLRLEDAWLARRLAEAVSDPRLGVAPVERPRTYVVDYSAPNVAKSMHVGHIRSTVIGDSICRILRFLGHQAISDNHIGDWGTQFGMIIYGYKHFLDEPSYQEHPVEELGRLYRLVRQLVDYHEALAEVAALEQSLELRRAALSDAQELAAVRSSKPDKDAAKNLRRLEGAVSKTEGELKELRAKIATVEGNPSLRRLVEDHAGIGAAVLAETAKLHAGDPENLRLWHEVLPPSLAQIVHIYRRLGVTFDHALGESYYHDRLAPIVDELLQRGIARESEGAICVFNEGMDSPLIVRKKDGAFLYATTDLATVRYRMETFHPDAVLYVVDFRQSDHFEHLFATARRLGYERVEFQHVSFGTVLADDGRPFRTRSGDTVGLESLLDEAVRKAAEIVSANESAKPEGPELSGQEMAEVAEIVGIGALKYADLSQNRTSDYVFSYEKMLAMNGNTATYMQYAYARVRSIFAKGRIDVAALRASGSPILLTSPYERALGLELLRFGEALDLALEDYRPNQLTSYLFDLANRYASFYEHCHVLNAETEELRASRLLLCDLTARTLRQGLELLGIQVVDKM